MSRSIMIQGTMSGAGKSLLCAALCRIFWQDGHHPAPFKSQNMALNSYITRDGLEMGRAQVLQAQAAGLEPDVRMNPILLKPSGDTSSQVIVNGEVLGDFTARDYFRQKRRFIPDILQAYHALEKEADILVIEGAGSPAEINLRRDDIVNMGLAELVDAPVLLVGNIDPGGVFAQLVGTQLLLSESERQRIRGFVVNKFRGDVRLLEPGFSLLRQYTPTPVLGVIPYLRLDLEEEDSLSARLSHCRPDPDAVVDIAVIRLPHLSNYTDFDELSAVPGVDVRYVAGVRDLERPDLIILPGTKNTMGDLKWLREQGLDAAILSLHDRSGVPVLGICGGYQMMGETLSDPDGIELAGEERGLGLLPVHTRFAQTKRRTRVRGFLLGEDGSSRGCRVEGYEIHMGRTMLEAGAQPLTRIQNLEGGDWRPDGCRCGSAAGTYLHGILDGAQAAGELCRRLAAAKGAALPQGEVQDRAAVRERELDRLAAAVRQSLDLDAVYRIIERRD